MHLLLLTVLAAAPNSSAPIKVASPGLTMVNIDPARPFQLALFRGGIALRFDVDAVPCVAGCQQVSCRSVP